MGLMMHDIGMVINEGRNPKMFLMSFHKSLCRFLIELLTTIHFVPLIPVDYSTFLCDGILFLEDYQEVSDGVSSFEVHIYSHFITNVLKSFIQSFDVRYNLVRVIVLVMKVCLLFMVMVFIVPVVVFYPKPV